MEGGDTSEVRLTRMNTGDSAIPARIWQVEEFLTDG